jgi:hypothetical protein
VRGVETITEGGGGPRAAGGEMAAKVERAFFGRGIPRGDAWVLHGLE